MWSSSKHCFGVLVKYTANALHLATVQTLGVNVTHSPGLSWHSFFGFQGHPRKGNGQFPGVFELNPTTQVSITCQSNLKAEMEQTNLFPCPLDITLQLSSHSHDWVIVAEERTMHVITCHGLRELTPFAHMRLEIRKGEGPEKCGKLAYIKTTCVVPACKVEIGNWAVVITGCGIDVVPINQNCWINKKNPQIFF